MHPFFLLVAKRHCLIDRCSQKTPNTTAICVDAFQSRVFCTASHFLLPYTTCFHFFTAQTPVRCELTLRQADRGIQVTPMHSSSSMDEDNFNSSRANLNKRSEARLHQETLNAKSSLLWKPPPHSLCLAAFSLQWISKKFQTQDLLVRYTTSYLGNTMHEQ